MSDTHLEVPIVIIGGGLTGLSAAWHLRGQDYILLEKEDQAGGLARTYNYDGFKFDRGSHVWFPQDDYIDSLVRSLPDVLMRKHKRSAWVHIFDKRIPAPFQANLFGLPLEVISECLVGYIEAAINDKQHAGSYDDWLRASFGDGIYRHFMKPYNSKVWTVSPEELTADWQGARVNIPNTRELIDGAIGLHSNHLGSNSQFSYPAAGTQSLAAAIEAQCSNIITGACVAEVNLHKKIIILSDNRQISFKRLINTMPLPHFINLIPNADNQLMQAGSTLRWTKVALTSICLKNKPKHDYHWIYFSEKKYPFYRIHFPHNYSSTMCPEGHGSVQAECAFLSGVILNTENISKMVQASLSEAGYINTSETMYAYTSLIDPAYVLYDHGRQRALDNILPILRNKGVYSCGRFGGWEYLNMDGCILAGKRAAEWALEETNHPQWQELAETVYPVAGITN